MVNPYTADYERARGQNEAHSIADSNRNIPAANDRRYLLAGLSLDSMHSTVTEVRQAATDPKSGSLTTSRMPFSDVPSITHSTAHSLASKRSIRALSFMTQGHQARELDEEGPLEVAGHGAQMQERSVSIISDVRKGGDALEEDSATLGDGKRVELPRNSTAHQVEGKSGLEMTDSIDNASVHTLSYQERIDDEVDLESTEGQGDL